MAWFFSGNDDDDDDVFSGGFSLGDLFGQLFRGGIFGSLFDEPEEIAHNPLSHLSKKEQDFIEKIRIVLGDDTKQIDPESHFYEAHKMRLYFELEDEMLFGDLTEYEKGVKQYERECYCHTHGLCTKCYEKLEEGVCVFCGG